MASVLHGEWKGVDCEHDVSMEVPMDVPREDVLREQVKATNMTWLANILLCTNDIKKCITKAHYKMIFISKEPYDAKLVQDCFLCLGAAKKMSALTDITTDFALVIQTFQNIHTGDVDEKDLDLMCELLFKKAALLSGQLAAGVEMKTARELTHALKSSAKQPDLSKSCRVQRRKIKRQKVGGTKEKRKTAKNGKKERKKQKQANGN